MQQKAAKEQQAAKAGVQPDQDVAAADMDGYGAVVAEVRVEGVDSFVLSSAQFGDYYRCNICPAQHNGWNILSLILS